MKAMTVPNSQDILSSKPPRILVLLPSTLHPMPIGDCEWCDSEKMEDFATGLALVSGVELPLILAISRFTRTQSSSQAAQGLFRMCLMVWPVIKLSGQKQCVLNKHIIAVVCFRLTWIT